MAENVRVVVRCRPMSMKERAIKSQNIIQINDCTVMVQNPSDGTAPIKVFTYDSAYDGLAQTEDVYNDICYSLVENVLEGYNGTIFAYGQTGCGKSYTMQGPDVSTNSDMCISQRGIISRAFDHIFEAISVASGVRYLALVSYLEIYNENIRDLLKYNEVTSHPLKEIPGEGVLVPTLSTHAVHNAQECEQLLSLGSRNRAVGSTLMNSGSSRSHSIFTISLEHIEDSEKRTTTTGGIRKGKLNLVDLAGSERQSKTGADGRRLREATKINMSLSALGNVISALVDGKAKHIPYRDSKLTRLLQDSLGGNTKTLMIACISPADYNYDETISTLRYASRAKNISNKPKINEDPKDAILREYQKEILKLKEILRETQVNLESVSKTSNESIRECWEQNKTESEQVRRSKEVYQEMPRCTEDYFEQVNHKEQLAYNSNQTSIFREPEWIKVQQLEARKRIEVIKNTLIGGEKENDAQLKERRQKKKLAAQRRLSTLAHILSRVEQTEYRDLLQDHYKDIHHELSAKNESLKTYRQKVKALDREVSDLQAEFQLERADYLESIRRLEQKLKFYQQLLEKALPILRKDGKYWDPDDILQNSSWNDDIKAWKLPDSSLNNFRMPPAIATNCSAPWQGYLGDEVKVTANDLSEGVKDNEISTIDENPETIMEDLKQSHSGNILNNYFRSSRQRLSDPANQIKGSDNWRILLATAATLKPTPRSQTRASSSWTAHNHGNLLNKTWCGADSSFLERTVHDNPNRASPEDVEGNDDLERANLRKWLPKNNSSLTAYIGLKSGINED